MENQELRERGIGFSYQIYRTKRDAEETVKSLTGLPIREMRGEEKRREEWVCLQIIKHGRVLCVLIREDMRHLVLSTKSYN